MSSNRTRPYPEKLRDAVATLGVARAALVLATDKLHEQGLIDDDEATRRFLQALEDPRMKIPSFGPDVTLPLDPAFDAATGARRVLAPPHVPDGAFAPSLLDVLD